MPTADDPSTHPNPSRLPLLGDVVRVRARRHLVEDVVAPGRIGEQRTPRRSTRREEWWLWKANTRLSQPVLSAQTPSVLALQPRLATKGQAQRTARHPMVVCLIGRLGVRASQLGVELRTIQPRFLYTLYFPLN